MRKKQLQKSEADQQKLLRRFEQINQRIEKLLDGLIETDTEIGRSESNFFPRDFLDLSASLKELSEKGWRIFKGGGNIFIFQSRLFPDGSIRTQIHQIRPLAQRYFEIRG